MLRVAVIRQIVTNSCSTMLALLFLVAAAAADPLVITKKILPLFEDSLTPHNIADTRTALRAWCLDDCHHHVLDKPVLVAVKNTGDKWDLHYLPLGLNHLTKSPLTAPIKDLIAAKGLVGVVSPMSRFPFELFPGMLDTEVFIPEHHNKLSFLYKEAPILVLMPEGEFKTFNEKRGYTPLADLTVDDIGFSLLKDYALMYRHAALKSHGSAPGLYYLVPSAAPTQNYVPTSAGLFPLSSSEYLRYISAAQPVTNPALAKTFSFY